MGKDPDGGLRGGETNIRWRGWKESLERMKGEEGVKTG